MSGKRTNSRAKGAQGEREAAKYLTSLGFKAGRMGRNGYSAADLDCAECPTLSRVHVEVKRNESFDLHTKALDDACVQAQEAICFNGKRPQVFDDNDAQRYTHPKHATVITMNGRTWAVLWRRNNRPWNLTFVATQPPLLVTVTGDDRIREALRFLAGQGEG
jgi:hypothetical protein